MENKKTSFHKFMDATSGVKVELSIIDDLKKVSAQLNTRALELLSEIDNIKQSKQRAISAYNTLLKQRSDLELIVRNYNNAAKELGMTTQEFPEVAKAKNTMTEAMKAYTQEV